MTTASTGLPSHANLGSCSNSAPHRAQRIGLVHDGEAILGVVMVPMTVCTERVDWYGVGFWGERVADPFL